MRRSALHRLLATAVAAAVLGGCSAFTSEAPPVADSTMVDLLIELHLAQARQTLYADLDPARRDTILADYGLDRDGFEAAMAYYAEHPETLAEVYRQALDRLGEERPPQHFDLRSFRPDSARTER